MIRTASFALALVFATAPVVAEGQLRAGRVVTDTLWAPALGVRKELRVYLPPSYDARAEARFPVAYYLHGWTGNERNWVDVGRLDAITDSLVRRGLPEMIIAMPDGDDSWYTTWNTLENFSRCRADTTRAEPAATYCVAWPHYDDYIVHDVVSYVDRRYRTKADRAHRGIAGLSMGGYGAITLAINNPTVFAAAASHSGVLAPSHPAEIQAVRNPPMERLAALRQFYGAIWPSMALAFGRDSTAWRAREPAVIVGRALARKQSLPAIYIDVGRDDRFLAQNRSFYAALAALNVRHVYRERPGAHDWNYWRANLPRSLAWLGTVIAK